MPDDIFLPISGCFYRIVPKTRKEFVLSPAVSPEGRFHHDGQAVLYVSPRPEWAQHAIDTYVRKDDPPRVICELEIGRANVLDLRDAAQCADWDADPGLGVVPWMPERERGELASTWRLSDMARDRGADGMIYVARSDPGRWHLVMLNWSMARLTGRIWDYPLSESFL